MADSILETTAIRVVVDEQALQAAVDRVKNAVQNNRINLNVNSGAATKGMSEALAQAKALGNEAATLRQRFQATGQEFDSTRTRLASIKTEALALSQGFAADTTEARRFAQAARYADATIAGMEGRMSRLGLASQVNLAAMQGLTGSMYRFGPAGMVVGSAMNSITAAGGAVSIATLGAAAGIAGLGAAAFELTRRGIPQIEQMQAATQLLIASGDQLAASNLAKNLDEVAQSAGKAGAQFSRGQLATALSELVKAGTTANQAMRLLAPGMQLASVTGQNLNDSTALLLQNLRQFGLTADSAQRAANDLAKADLLSASSAQALSEGLATVGPVAAQAGLSLESTLGALVNLSNKGLDPATTGGNALRVVMTSLLKPSNQAQHALEALGVSTKDANGHQRTMQAILTDLIKSVQNYGITIDKNTGQVVGNQDAIAELAKIFRTRGITAIAALDSSWAQYTKTIQNSQGAVESYANTMLSSNLTASLNALNTSLNNLGESFLTTFAPGITKTADALTTLFQQLDKLGTYKNLFSTVGHIIAFPATAGNAIGNMLMGNTSATSPMNANGGVGSTVYGPPPSPNAGAGAGAGANGGAAMPILSQSQRVAQATPLVEAYKRAMAGTSVDALIGAQSALTDWEAAGGNKAEAALRASVVSALQTTLNNATKGAAKDLAAPPGASELHNGAYRTGVALPAQASAAAAAASELKYGTGVAGELHNGAYRAGVALPALAAADQLQRERAQRTRVAIEAFWTHFTSQIGDALATSRDAWDTARVRADAQAGVALDAQDRARNANSQQSTSIFAQQRAEQASKEALARVQSSLAYPGGRTPEVAQAAATVGAWLKNAIATVLKGAAQEAVNQSIAAGTVGAGYWDMQTSYADMIRGGTVLPRTGTAGYGTALPGQVPTTGSFTDTLNALEGAGREIYANQRKAGQEQQKSAKQFAQTVVQAGGSFAQAIISGSPGGIVSGGFGAAGSILGSIGGDVTKGLSFSLLGTIVSTVGGILGGIIEGLTPRSRPAPVGGAFGATRPNIGNPDIALSVGTSQASLGPAISSKILDAGNLFDQAASRFDGAVDKIIAGVSSKIQKPNYTTSANL